MRSVLTPCLTSGLLELLGAHMQDEWWGSTLTFQGIPTVLCLIAHAVRLFVIFRAAHLQPHPLACRSHIPHVSAAGLPVLYRNLGEFGGS